MPPARRPLRTLGSLQLVEYANNPTRVITELAFIADTQVNTLEEGGQSDFDTPLEVQFEEFIDGVNSRGRGTKTRQKMMTVEQAAAILLVTVQKGHVELIAKKNDPYTIDVIKVLPEAKRILAAFLPKLRGYGDIPYDQQYRGAIALAKRHFFPKGKPPTKKELMALLLQSYQEKRELSLKYQNLHQPSKTFGIQTSLQTIGSPPVSNPETANSENAPCVHPVTCADIVEMPVQLDSQSKVELPNSDFAVDVEPIPVASRIDPNLDDHILASEGETEVDQLLACTPVVPRAFNPYMTPTSNPRHVDYMAATPSSPIAASNDHPDLASDEDDATDEEIGELLQATATSQGRLNYCYDKFIAACQRITFLEGEKEKIQREFDLTRKKLDETEHRLREVNADRSELRKWVDKLHRQVGSIYDQLGSLRGVTMADPQATDN